MTTADEKVTEVHEYWIVVLGPDGRGLGRTKLNCSTTVEAVAMACTTQSPFGHELWSTGGFIGRFEMALSAADPK
ncbi:hypothetical protein LJR164_004560 [Phenylobacterium sp. LjRoot164]|uniref:hypothetical protein n=1 Tax=unclassified Phenylobacterium TaxID=2640670 RepID=UPI003ECD79E1